MNGQISLFDFISENEILKPGEYVETNQIGKELTFDEITIELERLIVIDCSTESHNWYKVVKVEKIITYEDGTRRLVYYDGKKQRGLVNEMYFDKRMMFPVRAWRLN